VSTALAFAVVDEAEDRNTWSSVRSNTPAVVHCGLSHVADPAMGSEQKTAPWLNQSPIINEQLDFVDAFMLLPQCHVHSRL
jgi:hypothetical protein